MCLIRLHQRYCTLVRFCVPGGCCIIGWTNCNNGNLPLPPSLPPLATYPVTTLIRMDTGAHGNIQEWMVSNWENVCGLRPGRCPIQGVGGRPLRATSVTSSYEDRLSTISLSIPSETTSFFPSITAPFSWLYITTSWSSRLGLGPKPVWNFPFPGALAVPTNIPKVMLQTL